MYGFAVKVGVEARHIINPLQRENAFCSSFIATHTHTYLWNSQTSLWPFSLLHSFIHSLILPYWHLKEKKMSCTTLFCNTPVLACEHSCMCEASLSERLNCFFFFCIHAGKCNLKIRYSDIFSTWVHQVYTIQRDMQQTYIWMYVFVHKDLAAIYHF